MSSPAAGMIVILYHCETSLVKDSGLFLYSLVSSPEPPPSARSSPAPGLPPLLSDAFRCLPPDHHRVRVRYGAAVSHGRTVCDPLVKLCTDIRRRNGKKKPLWPGSRSCPGDRLCARHGTSARLSYGLPFWRFPEEKNVHEKICFYRQGDIC